MSERARAARASDFARSGSPEAHELAPSYRPKKPDKSKAVKAKCLCLSPDHALVTEAGPKWSAL
jgi:hypothetical protein